MALLCGGLPLATGCTGLSSDVDYPDEEVDLDSFVLTPEGDPDPAIGFGRFQFSDKACEGIPTHPIVQTINQEDLTRFFAATGLKTTIKKARADLYWFELPAADGQVLRLRLAILPDAEAAALDLHQSLLEHGPGWWGLRRSNLAILAPRAGLSEAAEFAVRTKLVCWGMFTYTGVDDVYVVRGPYGEL